MENVAGYHVHENESETYYILSGTATKAAVFDETGKELATAGMDTAGIAGSVQVNETGAFGCALIGAAAEGAYDDIAGAAKNMCRISEPVIPDMERAAVYDKKYELYCKTIEALDGLWDSIQNYKDGQ